MTPAPRPHAPAAACKDVGGRMAVGLGGGLVRRPAGLLLSFSLEGFEVHATDDVVAAQPSRRQVPAVYMAPEGLTAHTEQPGSFGDQDHVFHASKRTNLLTTVKAYHSCVSSGSMVQCNHGKQLVRRVSDTRTYRRRGPPARSVPLLGYLMFEVATNATQTPIVPQDRFIAECVRLEEAPPYAAPGEQPKPGARPGIRWILALYSPTTGDQFYFQDEPYEFFQTTTANMQRGARAREFAEAFLGREIGEGEKLSPDMLLGKRCVGMVIHELSRDKTKKNAKLVAVEPFKNVATAPKPAPTQVSADPQIEDVDRALVVASLHKSVSALLTLDAASGKNAQEAIAQSDLETAPIATLQELLDSVKKAVAAAM